MSKKDRPPKKIYLQYYFDDEGYQVDDEVTWCVDQINENDVPYIIDPRYWMSPAALKAAGE